MIFDRNQRIVFIGDSVTDCGRRDEHAPLGDGYVRLIANLLSASHPELALSWVNVGVSGDTVRDLDNRWATDAVGQTPDWLSVMIGINDVWRAIEGRPDEAVPVDEYERTLRRLLQQAVDATGCRLVVAGPYLIEPDLSDEHRRASDRHAAAAAGVAAELGAVYVDTQAAFDQVLRDSAASQWAYDRIHPTGPGHAVIALAYLRALGGNV